MTKKDITNYLDKKKIKHEVLEHGEVYTAIEAAKKMKVAEKDIAKVLILKVDGKKFVMAVLPANMAAKLKKIKKNLEAKSLELATETEMRKKTGLKPGSAPALGKMLKLTVYADTFLEKNKNIVFPAGDYKTSIKMGGMDWFMLEKPEVLEFSVKPSPRKKKPKKSPKKRSTCKPKK